MRLNGFERWLSQPGKSWVPWAAIAAVVATAIVVVSAYSLKVEWSTGRLELAPASASPGPRAP
jgi:hypothetical protein